MWLSQPLVTVSANTLQPTEYTTSTSLLALDKPLPAAPFAESDTHTTYLHSANTNHLPSQPQSSLPVDQHPIIIAVIGHKRIGKSNMIQHGFPQCVSYHYQDITVGENKDIRQHSYMVHINNELLPRNIIFLEMDHLLKDDDLTTSFHAALICYDVTQQQSMTGVPDLLSVYHSQQLPIYILGLHSDPASTRQVDYTLGEQLAQHFRVKFYEMKTNDALTIHHMFMNLLRKCVSTPVATISNDCTDSSPPVIRPASSTPPPPPPPSPATNIDGDDDTSKIKMTSSATIAEVVNLHPVENNHHHRDNNQVRHPASNSISEVNAAVLPDDPNAPCSTVGFVYAPTTITADTPPFHDNTTSTAPLDSPHDMLLSFSSSRIVSTDNFAKCRRGSKDSGDSLGTGLSVDAIIDRLVTPGTGRCDELMIPIFIIFFRKFMSPYELIQVLIKRFENDLCMPSLPTPLQQRITSVLITWMGEYWCDFYHRQTRNQLQLFLGRLSALILSTTSSSSLQSLLEKLYPLSLQPTPDFDPDDTWGKKDMDAVTIDHSKKKDSGYISSYLGASYTSLVPESSTSDLPLGDLIWSRRPSATSAPSASPPLPPLTSSVKGCASSVAPDSCNGSTSSPSPTSRIHMAPSNPSLPPSPPATSSGSTTPSFIHSKSNDGHQHKSITHTSSKRHHGAATPSSSSSSPNTTLTRPEFAGGLIHPLGSPKTPIAHGDVSLPLLMRYNPRSTGIADRPSIPSSPPPSSRPYYPTGLTAPQPPSPLPFADKVPQQLSQAATIQHTARPMTDPVSIKRNTKLLLSLPSQDMAVQLTWIEAELFGKIKSREFVRMIWATNDKAKHQPQTRPNSMASLSSEEQEDFHLLEPAPRSKSALLSSISHFNFISAWVISMIVTQPKLAKRVALLEKFMTIAVALRDLNNYNSLMAILAGVNNAAILRMKHTQEAIKKKKIYKRFQSLEKLMSSDRSYSSYRIALKAHTPSPSIPYLGIHSQDLIALDEANKDVKADGTIHWDKFRLMGESIMMVIKLQQQQHPKHTLTPSPAILNWIATCSILTEEEQYTQSILTEPRLKTTKSMTRLRDLWFRT